MVSLFTENYLVSFTLLSFPGSSLTGSCFLYQALIGKVRKLLEAVFLATSLQFHLNGFFVK